jgi:hypothetical protein
MTDDEDQAEILGEGLGELCSLVLNITEGKSTYGGYHTGLKTQGNVGKVYEKHAK